MSLSENLEKVAALSQAVNFCSINECAQAMSMFQAGLSKSISTLESALNSRR